MNVSNMFRIVKKVAERSGKSGIFIFFDIIWCGFKYQAGYSDYDVFVMERTNKEQRETFITRGVNNKYIAHFNNPEYYHYFINKDEFNTAFADFIGRDWVKTDNIDTVKEWIQKRERFVAKPRDGMCGKGIEILRTADFDSADKACEYISGNNFGVLEDVIKQNEKINTLYNGSINTVRIVTMNNKGKISVVVTYFRIGNGKHVDNFNSGGMMTRVNPETGVVMFPAVDKANIIYEKHPETGTEFVGFSIPFWKENLELVKKAAAVIPQVGMVGWDIAVTPDGPVLVEGNEYPGHDIYQMPVHTPDNYGLKPIFDKALNS